MSMLDEIVTAYNFDKLNALTKYPKILSYFDANNQLSTANYQPIPPHPEKMNITIKELIDGEIIRIIVLDNDYFVGDSNEIIHARGDRIIINPLVVPMYRSLMGFFNANMSNRERLMVLYGVVFGGQVAGNERYVVNNANAKCLLVDGFTMKVQDVVGIIRDNNLDVITDWVNTLHQPFWTTTTLDKFCTTCKLEKLPVLAETTLDKIPTEIEEMKKWAKQYEQSGLFVESDEKKEISLEDIINDTEKRDINSIKAEEDLDELFNPTTKIEVPSKFKQSKGVVIRSIDRSYIRQINFNNFLQ